MVIHEAHITINALKDALPDGFVFVIDTTDRTFIYKSLDHAHCEEMVLRMDESHGIDILLREQDFYLDSNDRGTIGLRNLSKNTHLGFCLPHEFYKSSDTDVAESIIRNEMVLM